MFMLLWYLFWPSITIFGLLRLFYSAEAAYQKIAITYGLIILQGLVFIIGLCVIFFTIPEYEPAVGWDKCLSMGGSTDDAAHIALGCHAAPESWNVTYDYFHYIGNHITLPTSLWLDNHAHTIGAYFFVPYALFIDLVIVWVKIMYITFTHFLFTRYSIDMLIPQLVGLYIVYHYSVVYFAFKNARDPSKGWNFQDNEKPVDPRHPGKLDNETLYEYAVRTGRSTHPSDL